MYNTWLLYCSSALALNNDKVRKNINIVLVIIFDKFENLPKIVFTRTFECDYCGLYLRKYFMCM